jgi:hypothetical protein
MNAEDLMRAQAEALEMLADQQMRMVRDREVQEALKEVKSPAAKRSLGKLLMWRYTMEDLEALWQPLANVAIEQGCNLVRIDNVEEVQRVVTKQGRLMAQMQQELKDEVEAQTLGASSFMGGNLVKFKEGSGLFGNPMVPIQAKDVRQWEHQYAQRSRDESTARAAMATFARGCQRASRSSIVYLHINSLPSERLAAGDFTSLRASCTSLSLTILICWSASISKASAWALIRSSAFILSSVKQLDSYRYFENILILYFPTNLVDCFANESPSDTYKRKNPLLLYTRSDPGLVKR